MAVRAKHVFRWDLDKTYLRTEFDSVRDIIGRAFESAHEKQTVPGAATLLRRLRRTLDHRICIVSGSPSQMRQVLAAKLALDGVEYDEFVLKNQFRNILRGRLRALKSQVPYKLPALLESRTGLLGSPPETLFGDDAEADAIVYSLYAEILADRVPRDQLFRILKAARAYDDEIDRTIALADQVKRGPAVQRIMIHLDKRTPTGQFEVFGTRVVAIYNYFQAALMLYDVELLSARDVAYIGKAMLATPEYELSALANSLQDLLLRGRLTYDTAQRLSLELQNEKLEDILSGDDMPSFEEIAWTFALRVNQLGGAKAPEQPLHAPRLDFVDLVDREYKHRQK